MTTSRSITLTAEVQRLGDRTVARLLARPGRWIADLEHDDVWGWQLAWQQGRNVALVYYRKDHDFELDDAVVLRELSG